MTCPDCTTAAQVSHWGFSAGCRGCKARAAARLPQWRRVCQDGMFQDRQYRRLLEQLQVTHEEVCAAAATDKVEGDGIPF